MISKRVFHVLFVCTHNSARSIMAEALLNHLGRPGWQAWSAGSHPSGQVRPQALHTLSGLGVEAGHVRSKDWSEFALPGAPRLDFVITVCDQAAGEVCPVWPGQPMTAHWGVPAPARDGAGERAYREAALTLKRRIELMLVLPVASLQRLSLQAALDDIGRA